MGAAIEASSSFGRDFYERVIALNQQGAWSVVEGALSSGVQPVDIYGELVVPALRTIGEQWEAGQVTVGGEHAVTMVCQRIVGRLGSLIAKPEISKGAMVLGCVPGEMHGLASSIAADVFRAAGYEVVEFGADLPPRSFAEAGANTPELVAVGLSATLGGSEESIAETIATVRSVVDALIMLGGPGVPSLAAAHQLGADSWAPTAAEGVTRLNEALS